MDDSALAFARIFKTSNDDIMLLSFYIVTLWPSRGLSSIPLRYMSKHMAEFLGAFKSLERLGFVRQLDDGYTLTDETGLRFGRVLAVSTVSHSFYSLALMAMAGPDEPERVRRLLVRIACLWDATDFVSLPTSLDASKFASNFSSWPCEEGLFRLMSYGRLWLLLGCWDKIRQVSNNFDLQLRAWSITLDCGLTINTQCAYDLWHHICQCEEVLGIPVQDRGKDETTEDDVKGVINHLMWVFADSHLMSIPLENGRIAGKMLSSGRRVDIRCQKTETFSKFIEMHIGDVPSGQAFPAADTMIVLPMRLFRAHDGLTLIALDSEVTILDFSDGLTGWQMQHPQ
jgi:hypothetical protein